MNTIRKEINKDGTFGGNFPYDISYASLPDKFIEISEQQRDYIDSNLETLRYDETQEGIFEIPKGIIDISTTEEYLSKKLEQAKKQKLAQNQEKREEGLLSGVSYKGILFDSDTEQKTNLLLCASRMSDTETITWYGKDNVPLNCTKQDLLAIGNQIAELSNNIWTNLNPIFIEKINTAKTIEEVQEIEINYN
jgi:hypothetical protein